VSSCGGPIGVLLERDRDDVANLIAQRPVLASRYFLERAPKIVLEPDADLLSVLRHRQASPSFH
jgi:hypothetical protein